jgi:ribosome-associated translation inhibitor RaiA
MTIEIRGTGSEALRARVQERLGRALAPLRVRPVAAVAAFVDDNGPRGGPAIRCALTVRLPFRPTVRVEHVADTARLAFDGALPVLERALERYRELDRERRRRPKKYYVAKRLARAE